jgi:hypothetical protein
MVKNTGYPILWWAMIFFVAFIWGFAGYGFFKAVGVL